jgi:hypothetical protein
MGLILDSSVVIAAERRGDTVERLIERVVSVAGDQDAALSAAGFDFPFGKGPFPCRAHSALFPYTGLPCDPVNSSPGRWALSAREMSGRTPSHHTPSQ